VSSCAASQRLASRIKKWIPKNDNKYELFKRLSEATFSLYQTLVMPKKKIYEQKKSMDKLIICGLKKKNSANKYSLTKDGKNSKCYIENG
jgi:hypothetical protein